MENKTPALIAVMGATGTGKSSFIHQLTNAENIHIGHSQESETFDIQTAGYIDEATNRPVILIDTPGFDDSREGANSDTDILQKIIDFLEPEGGERRKLNGIIYAHRISDPRVGGNSRKNLRMFRALCGEDNLRNVHIVTTNWDRVTKEEGNNREADLKNGAFKYLVDAGAQMRRHTNSRESALKIMSDLIPLPPVTMKIQEQVADGMTLADTDAGQVLTAEMRALQKKHEQEMADLKKEMEAAAHERNQALRAELESERKALEEKIARVEADRTRLEKTVEELRAEQQQRQDGSAELMQMTVKMMERQQETLVQMARDREEDMKLRMEELNQQRASDRDWYAKTLAQMTNGQSEQVTARENELRLALANQRLQELEKPKPFIDRVMDVFRFN